MNHDPELENEIKSILIKFGNRCPGVSRSLRSEKDKFKLLFALNEENNHKLGESFQRWFTTHELLRWYQDTYVDGKRNKLIHCSVQLQDKLFDEMFRESLKQWGDIETIVENDQGPWILLGLTYSSFEAIPGTERTDADVVRILAERSWSMLIEHADLEADPFSWTDWDSRMQNIEVLLQHLRQKMESAFHKIIQEQQRAVGEAFAGWKEEMGTDIKNSGSPAEAKKLKKIFMRLKNYPVPYWGHYMAQSFMDADLARNERNARFDIMASLP